tara:strand:+ start:13359 stop:14654 length:1296 start_codon:yes stop_codon:yes gene_type:complete
MVWSSDSEMLPLRMMGTRNLFAYFFCFGMLLSSVAQEGLDRNEKDYIKTIQFSSLKQNDAFPIVALNEKILLKFDDLNGDEADYYYRISYFNHDWSPSTLFKNEFINGFDNVRINNYTTSFNTLQTYTHYQLELPNEDVQFKVSGNYLLEVFSSTDELAFSRRFCIYETMASVQVGIYRPQNMDRFNAYQSVHFAITPYQSTFRNPDQNITVVLLQNQQWDKIITGLTPQYFSGKTLEYRYDIPAQFEGGNEYFYFDTKDLRVTSPNINYINRAELYESYLNIDIPRMYSEYTYAPDINGKFEIRNIMGPGDPETHADYSYVYFSLAADYQLNDEEIFIYGNFNNYQLNELNKMYYNPSLEIFEGILLLKQGFYNYKYIIKEEGVLNKNKLSGSHSLTENDYHVLVYYRILGEQYDALIGVGSANSFNLIN